MTIPVWRMINLFSNMAGQHRFKIGLRELIVYWKRASASGSFGIEKDCGLKQPCDLAFTGGRQCSEYLYSSRAFRGRGLALFAPLRRVEDNYVERRLDLPTATSRIPHLGRPHAAQLSRNHGRLEDQLPALLDLGGRVAREPSRDRSSCRRREGGDCASHGLRESLT